MSQVEITASFGAAVHDRSALPSADRRALEQFYHHPIAHNLDWRDVRALFARIGAVVQEADDKLTLSVGDETLRMGKAHGKDLSADEVMGLRHLLTRSGWGPGRPAEAGDAPAAATLAGDVMVIIEAGGARVLPLDVNAADTAGHAVDPVDPLQILRHLSHHDQGRDAEKRTKEAADFHEAILQTLTPGVRIVLVGHGDGHSNAARQFQEFLQHRHPRMFRQVAGPIAADLSAVTDHQLLVLARHALAG